MAGVTRVHGEAGEGQFVHRDLWFKNYDKGSAISQDEMEDLVRAIGQTSTIEVIGAFEAGVSTAVKMVISGANTDDTADALVTGITGGDEAGWMS